MDMAWVSKAAAVSALGLPRDVILGDVLVSFVGRREVCIENYRSILMYTDTLVKLPYPDPWLRPVHRILHGGGNEDNRDNCIGRL